MKKLLLTAVLLFSLNSCAMSNDSAHQKKENDIPSDREIFGYIQDITGFGARRSGSEAGVKTAEYIAEKFRDFGLVDVSILKGDTLQWEATKWSLDIDGQTIPSFYMRYSFYQGKEDQFSTGENGLVAPVVYVGNLKNLDDIDVRGKIVVADVELSKADMARMKGMSDFIYDPAQTLPSQSRIDPFTPKNYPYNMVSAIEKGAVGFVGILTNYFDSNRYYNEDVAYLVKEDGFFTIPALWVNNVDGKHLKSLLEKNKKAQGKLVLEGAAEKQNYHTVVGHLPGKSSEMLMVQSHHDSGFLGAVEDASGVGEVLALAKYYGNKKRSDRERSMMFVTMDTHFTDYEAHVDLANDYIIDGKRDVVANVTVEHIAKEMIVSNGEAYMTGEVDPRIIISSPSLLALTQEKIEQHDFRRSIVVSTEIFKKYDDGIPTDVGVIQSLTGFPVISLLSAPVYLYDIADTLDKVAVDELQSTAGLLIDMLDKLDKMPREQIGRDE